MLGVTANVLLVLACVLCSLLMLVVLNWVWPREKRKVHNDLIGWQLTVLGTTYAVIVGFMLFTVWTDFGMARQNAEAEANALVNIHRLAAGIPAAQGVRLRGLAEQYADTVVEREWPVMERGGVSTESNRISRGMWRTLMSIHSPTWTEITAEDHALYELSTLTEHRQTRQLESMTKLPKILWCVLLIGGGLTMFSTCLFGMENTCMHGIQVASFALLMALSLMAIADIDRPFQGTVHVDVSPFVRARAAMQAQYGSEY